MRKQVGKILAIAMITVGLLSSMAFAKIFKFEDSYEYTVKPGFRLSVNNSSGSISISRQTGDKVVLRVIKQIDGSSREEAEEKEDRVDVTIRADEDRIDIDTRFPLGEGSDGFWGRLIGLDKGFNGNVSYEIEVPVSVELTVATVSGEVILTGLEGDAHVSATSSDISIRDQAGDCNIENTSGDLRLKNIKGRVEVSSTSSDALFDNIEGDLTLQSTSGETEVHWLSGEITIAKTSGGVRISECSGDIDVNSVSGDITVDQRDGGFTLSTTSGDVTVSSELANGDSYEVETISGDIELRVPSEIKGDVKLRTISGNIDTNLALEVRSFDRSSLEGRIRGGGAMIQLSSTSGDITLEEY